jgi:hypothetical protein
MNKDSQYLKRGKGIKYRNLHRERERERGASESSTSAGTDREFPASES